MLKVQVFKGKVDREQINSPLARIIKLVVRYVHHWTSERMSLNRLICLSLRPMMLADHRSRLKCSVSTSPSKPLKKDSGIIKAAIFYVSNLTSKFHLKKPQRIETLPVVMTTCLMVFAALEQPFRKRLKLRMSTSLI